MERFESPFRAGEVGRQRHTAGGDQGHLRSAVEFPSAYQRAITTEDDWP